MYNMADFLIIILIDEKKSYQNYALKKNGLTGCTKSHEFKILFLSMLNSLRPHSFPKLGIFGDKIIKQVLMVKII